MKSGSLLHSAIVLATFATLPLSAQSVDFLLVSKQVRFTQTDASTTALDANAWSFRAHVEGGEGSDLSGISAPTISLPGGSGSTTFAYDPGDDGWVVEDAYASQALLDAAYANGNYSLTVHGQTVGPISLAGDSYPVAPLAAVSGGGDLGFSAGVLLWNPSAPLTRTLSGTGVDHMGIYVDGFNYNDGVEGFGLPSLSFTVPAFSLVSGSTYFVELSFDDIVGGTEPFAFSGTGDMSEAQYAGVYTSMTKFTIQVIPEPSSFATLAGALGLASAALSRRRRA